MSKIIYDSDFGQPEVGMRFFSKNDLRLFYRKVMQDAFSAVAAITDANSSVTEAAGRVFSVIQGKHDLPEPYEVTRVRGFQGGQTKLSVSNGISAHDVDYSQLKTLFCIDAKTFIAEMLNDRIKTHLSLLQAAGREQARKVEKAKKLLAEDAKLDPAIRKARHALDPKLQEKLSEAARIVDAS